MNYIEPPKDLRGFEGNELKDFVQDDIISNLREGDLIIHGATGFGKTRTALKGARKFDEARHTMCVIVPTLDLKVQWEAQVNKKFTVVYVINSSVNEANDIIRHFTYLVVDEAHRVLNKNATTFSRVLTMITATRRLMLSATFKQPHFDFLEEHGFKTCYKISMYWCYKNGLIPDNYNFNIPIKLIPKEQNELIKQQSIIDKNSKFFYAYGITTPFMSDDVMEFELSLIAIDGATKKKVNSGLTISRLKGMLIAWKVAVSRRTHLLHNADNKIDVVNRILALIPNRKCMVFANTIAVIDYLEESCPTVVSYHSKITSKQAKKDKFSAFFDHSKPHLATINTIIEGFDLSEYAKTLGFDDSNIQCEVIIRMSYDSNPGKTTQTIGRILRFDADNPDKIAVQINLYVQDFKIAGKLFESQEKRWLINNLSDQVNISWINEEDLEIA